MGQLGLIQRNDHAENANTKSSNSTTGVQIRESLSTGLQGSTKTESQGTCHDGPTTAQTVTHGTGSGGSKKGTSSKDGNDSCSRILIVRANHGWTGTGKTYVSLSVGVNLVLKEGDAMT